MPKASMVVPKKEKTLRAKPDDLLAPTQHNTAIDLVKEATGERRLYSCVIDSLSYGNLDTALAHMRMQHGIVARGGLFVRVRDVEVG